jgi:hypothetical protein
MHDVRAERACFPGTDAFENRGTWNWHLDQAGTLQFK